MNFIRKFLVLILLVLLTSCASEMGNQDENVKQEQDKINLNVYHSDLIASLTDNEKYLNKDLFQKLDVLEDSDKINVIISLKSKGIADYFNDDTRGYKTISDFAVGSYANSLSSSMLNEQNQLACELLEKEYINKVNHSYTTLLNGFSATTTYGQYKKLVKAGLDVDITISEAYAEADYETVEEDNSNKTVTNVVNVYETGIFDSSNVKYDGENTAVAILDSGFDVHHTVFQNMPNHPMISMRDIENILYNSKAYGYKQDIKAQDVYLNAKIPFAYDYADKDPDVAPYDSDHGTHVAGIIGGKDEVITGVAVNTQLVLMKVFGDINNGALQDDILAALEDAILLGVDAINLSLGTACGFSRSSDNEYINVVYDKIEAAGISLLVAASNDYSSGYGGENSNTNKASNPDSATVGSPGTFKSTFSVASISGVKSSYIIDESGYTFFFNNANNNAGKAYSFYEMLYEALDANSETLEIEYVTVPGVGKKVNYSNINVKGKIALVKRGETSFQEKAQVALSEGAIGCIIYNNIAGEVYMNAGGGLGIALCSINKDDGEYLASKDSGKLILDKDYLAGPFMSDFSSWGPVSDLSLKPEITAHGGSILSSVPGGGYDEISGTSMACPNLCGVVMLVRQALKERYPEISAPEANNLANQLIMSTGTIVLDEYGNPYSPRKQGAGLANLEAALDTLAYVSVDDCSKAKIELKDDPEETGVYTLKFNINNLSNEEVKYALSNLTMTESLSTADPKYVAEKAYMLNPTTKVEVLGNGSIVNDEITVEANGSVQVIYTLTLSEEEIKYIRQSFINGMYVEGFVVLESLTDDIDLSVPFLAFFGDWTKAPLFDKTYFEVESEAHSNSIDEEDKLKADYYATTPLGTYYYSYIIPLGTYVYDIDKSKYDPIPATEDKAAIGYNIETINGITTVYAGLLRNAKKMTTVIKNASTGEVVYEHVKYDQNKAYFSGQIVPAYDLINVTAVELGLQNNTKYTFTMQAELDYKDGGVETNLNNTFEFSFYVDFQAPIIKDVEFYTKYDKSLKDYRYYCDVYVYDNHYAQSIRPFTISNGKLVSLSDNVIPIYGERGEISKVNIEITDYMDLLQYGEIEDGEYPMTNGLGFLVDDYALNQSYSFVTLPGTNSNEISFKEEFYSSANNGTYQYYKDIYVGDELDLTTMLTSNDPILDSIPEVQANYFSKLSWKSSNENIIKVKNGKIEAISTGNAVISCSTLDQTGYMYTINLRIKVRDKEGIVGADKLTDIEFTYFDTLKAFVDGNETSDIGQTGDRFFFTEKPNLSMFPSEQVKLGFELEPWNLTNYKLVWSSTNDKVATVSEDGVVTALKEGNATITLKIEINGKVSSLVASKRVTVKSEFVIEGTTLVAYKGVGGDVVIPDDEGILYIGPFAFSLYTNDYTIELPEGDYDAGKTPASNNTVTSVTIPYEVMEVQKYAFYNCTALEKVEFLTNDKNESCKIIREFAFANDEKLTDINLDNINMIGHYAFMNCKSLVDANISKVFAIGDRAFMNCEKLAYADITNLRNCGVEAFANCKALTRIDNGRYTNFSEGMFKNSGLKELKFEADRIPANCFANCKQLTYVEIKNTLVYVGANAFNNCNSLEEVKFNDGVGTQFIYTRAFNNCTSLSKVTLPDSNFDFEEKVFNNCNSLEEIVFNQNTNIVSNHGTLFGNCTNLTKFTVNPNNSFYSSNTCLLTNKSGNEIILAASGYDYTNWVIPSNITLIGEAAFSGISKLYNIVINDNITEIKARAFENCSNLSEVVLLNDNVIIGAYAFNNCSNLDTVSNLEKVKVFNAYSFANTALENITIVDSKVLEGAFSGIKTLTNVNVTSEEIGSYAFANCNNLASVVVNASVINNNAFANCINLNTLNLNGLITIGDSAFINNVKLETVKSSTLLYIGNYAFANCNNLTALNTPNVKTIGDYAFASTDQKSANKLTSLEFSNDLETIGEYAFYGSLDLVNVTIGNGLTSIGQYAFATCRNLEEISVLSNLEVIKECTFAEDDALVIVNIPGIKYIDGGAFMNCTSLANIDLTTVIEIGSEAFYYCSNLISVDLRNAKVIEAGAFLLASKLETVNIPVLERIEAQALSCINVSEIALPNTLKYIAPTAFYYNTKLVKFTNAAGEDTCTVNDYITLDEGVVYTKTANNKLLLTAYPTAKEADSYEVLFNTVRIDDYAGYFNKNIKELVFPDTLEFIGNNAFYGCTKLEKIEFKSVKAPTLEGTVSDLGIEYPTDSEVYKLLNKYFQFNGYYPLYYAQFKDLIGKTSKMQIVIPANEDVSGYDSILYQLYFDLENLTTSDYVALNSISIDYLNKVSKVPTKVLLSDEVIIQDARTAYNSLDQDLTKYGYSKEYLDELYTNLVNAEIAWNKLNTERISHVYEFLIKDIEALGSVYDFNKIKDYYSIKDRLDIIERHDLKYIDQSNVDSFKKGFDKYFKDLNDDVNIMTDISTLPTSTVNKVGLIVASSVLGLSGLSALAIILLKRKSF